MRAGTRAVRCRCMRAAAECADQRGGCRRLATVVRRQDARPVEGLQRRRADHAVACRRRLHPGQGRRQRPGRLHRYEETVRKLHPRLGLETLPRREQRYDLPRGRRPLFQGTLRNRPRMASGTRRASSSTTDMSSTGSTDTRSSNSKPGRTTGSPASTAANGRPHPNTALRAAV